MKPLLTCLLLVCLVFPVSCSEKADDKPDYPVYTSFSSYSHFRETLFTLASIKGSDVRDKLISAFIDSLSQNGQVPFVMNDSVAFIYFSPATTVSWPGDFNGWNPAAKDFQGKKAGLANLWINEQVFPHDGRLDYKIVVDGNWILDPLNDLTQWGGAGPNSELRMPGWIFPGETIKGDAVNSGSLGENIILNSDPANLGYQVQFRVYTPFNYNELTQLKTIYVTDGHEYSDQRLGAMITVLDNLIHEGKIEPLIAVFIDPRNPANLQQNRRMTEYAANSRFANFVADELVPYIDSHWKTDPDPGTRCILGTSMGGWNSAWFGYYRSDVFRNIAIHSPAFNQAMIDSYSASPLLPLKIYMATGVIYDTQERARAMRDVLQAKSYPLLYREVNQGHSWGSWRALIDEPLIWFYGK